MICPWNEGFGGGDRLPLWLSDALEPSPTPTYLVWDCPRSLLGRSLPGKADLLGVGVGCSHWLPTVSHLYSMALIIVLPEFIFIMATNNDLLRKT